MAGYSSLYAAYGNRYGVPSAYLQRVAQIESRENAGARNPRSSAGGLFQFIDSTANQYGLSDKFDPAASTNAAARLTADNRSALKNAIGREPSEWELYLAHQQGAGGASKLLANPSARAADVVGRDAVINNGGTADMTAGDFAGLWQRKYGGGSPARGESPAGLLPPAPGSVGRSYDGSGSGTSGTTGAGAGLLSFGFGGINENGTGGFRQQDAPMQINQGQSSALPSFAQPEAPTFEMEGMKPSAGGWGKGDWANLLGSIGKAAGAFAGDDEQQQRPIQAPAPPVNKPQINSLPEPQQGLLAPARRPARYRNPLSLLG